ncbi:hypothetical protein BLNAU_9154 [Blattamonas nauphoetae]|uniref:Uncharacterized protein n=1 Tax=Blattamonas nauphoetae TaxID=2049346 RepID=A0ABQ9XWE5_9EUKA|nr:hypothetical protein BLNAU_9154 [Blattamonas nauphoetae]
MLRDVDPLTPSSSRRKPSWASRNRKDRNCEGHGESFYETVRRVQLLRPDRLHDDGKILLWIRSGRRVGMFRRVQSNRHRSALCYRSALQQIGNLADFTVFSGILVYVLNPPVLREIKFSFTNNLSTSCIVEVSGSDLIASTEYTATSIVPLDEEDGDIFTDSSSSEESPF